MPLHTPDTDPDTGTPREEPYDPVERAAEKAASRAEDTRALASGEKTREQLSQENAFLSCPPDRVTIDASRVNLRRLERAWRRRGWRR